VGCYKYNKNGIRDKQRHLQPCLKMITRITKTSRKVVKNGRWKYLYVYNTNKGVALFRYAFSDEEACIKFKSTLGMPVKKSKKLKPDYPNLDILLNNNCIIKN